MAELRVGGRPAAAETTEPWRSALELAWTPETRPRTVCLGGRAVPSELLVGSSLRVPWLRTSIAWEDAHGAHRHEVKVAEGARPDDARIEVLRGFARMVAGLEAVRVEDAERLAVFSASTLWRWLEPSPVDTLVDSSLGALAEACARPRSWLREERLVEPVARVRRPARDAVHHLSRHPEHVGFDGVRAYPERLLSSIQEEELDIYENRVLVGLIRRLLQRAQRARQRVRLALDEAEGLREERDRAFRYAQYRRWGKMRQALQRSGEDIDVLVDAAAGYLRRLDLQARTLESCLHTPLGAALRLAPLPPSPLRETNILTWDARYRLLPELWRALDAEAGPDPLDLVLDDPDRAWQDFCLLTLTRALAELGFDGTGQIPCVLRGDTPSTVTFRRRTAGSDWVAAVTPEPGALTLRLGRERPPAAVPSARIRRAPGQFVADASEQRASPSTVIRLVPTFCGPSSRQAQAGPDDVWLHPAPIAELRGGTWGEVRAKAAVNAATDRAVAVAPWSFSSVDRLGRLIQIHTLGAELRAGEVRDECPSCRSPARRGREAQDRECTNPDCGASWGWRECQGCRARVPKLLPKAVPPEALEKLLVSSREPHQRLLLAEQLGGRELLADWCMDDTGIGTFWMVCPSCGTCGNPRCGSDGCAREQPQTNSQARQANRRSYRTSR